MIHEPGSLSLGKAQALGGGPPTTPFIGGGRAGSRQQAKAEVHWRKASSEPQWLLIG